MLLFDLYSDLDGLSGHKSGDMVELDGIDGFFDQYFAGRKEGATIQFVCMKPRNSPTNVQQLLDLPFFTAEIVEDHYDWARARLNEISKLGDWSLGHCEPPSLLDQLSFPVPLPTDLAALIFQAQTSRSAFWHSSAQHRHSLNDVTAIGALADADNTALWILTTNATPSYFARVG
jgi:hypothetical protein